MKIFKVSSISKKLIIIALLLSLLLIPLHFVKNLIMDRENHQYEAIQSIIYPLGGEAEINGVFIAVPYNSIKETVDSNGIISKTEETKYIIFTPEKYNVDVYVDSYFLNRGIFKVPVYDAKMKIDSTFDNFDFSNYSDIINTSEIKEALFMIGIPNKKNIKTIHNLKINDTAVNTADMTYRSLENFSNELCYTLRNISFNEKLELNAEIVLQGGRGLTIAPIANSNIINVSSNWNSPGFSGGFLPRKREISKDGFSATWEVSGINVNYPKSWINDKGFHVESFDINLVNHIDSYALIERSIKYGFLFLLIPFLAIFLLEVLSNIKVHPIQYILTGVTDIIFYLLLISISEHINFNISYIISSLAIISVSFLYICSIFKSLRCGCIISIIQLLSYVFLYAALQSEDYALLIGSIGLFTAVILIMFATRKIDWYNIENTIKNC